MMKKTGERLKTTREAQNLTISEISLITKISPRILQSIEAGELDKLPARTFLRGFILTYSQQLKLDPKEILDLFYEELEMLEPKPEVKAELHEEDTDLDQASSGKSTNTHHDIIQHKEGPVSSNPQVWKWASFVGLGLLIVLTFSIKKVIDKYQREKQIEPIPVSTNEKSESINEFKSIPVEQKQSDDKSIEKETAQNEKDKESVAKTNQVATAQIENQAIDEPQISQTPAVSRLNQEIILEALDRIEVNMQMGARNIKLVLQPDEVYSFKSSDAVQLEFSDGGAVNIIVNGKDRGVPGDLGVPKKITLP